MKAKNGFYSIIRHVPLPSSSSSEIVGVVLLCSDPDYIGVAFALQGLHLLGNVLDRFTGTSSEAQDAHGAVAQSAAKPAVFRSLTQLKEFLSGLGGEFQISAAQRISVEDPTSDIEGILLKSVLPPSKQVCQAPA